MCGGEHGLGVKVLSQLLPLPSPASLGILRPLGSDCYSVNWEVMMLPQRIMGIKQNLKLLSTWPAFNKRQSPHYLGSLTGYKAFACCYSVCAQPPPRSRVEVLPLSVKGHLEIRPWEGLRFRWGHEGEALMIGLVSLQEGKPELNSPSPTSLCLRRTEWEGGYLRGRTTVLTGSETGQHFEIPDLPDSRPVRINVYLFTAPSLWHFTRAIMRCAWMLCGFRTPKSGCS